MRKIHQMQRPQTLTRLSFTPVFFLSVPLIILPIRAHSLVAISNLISVFFTVSIRVTFVIIRIVLISVTLAAAVQISS